MTSPDKRARDADRATAMDLVREAFADGRIIEADRDKRLADLQHAQTLGDIETHVRDLRPPPVLPTYETYPDDATPPTPASEAVEDEPAAPDPAAVASATGQRTGFPTGPQYGPTSGGGGVTDITVVVGDAAQQVARRTRPLIFAVVAIVAIAVFGTVIGAVVSAFDDTDLGGITPTDDTTYAPGEEPGENGINLFTRQGYQDLVDAVAERGSTSVFMAVIYPRYAVVQIPEGPSGKRYRSFYYDGQLEESGSKGTIEYARTDLAKVRPGVILKLVELARSKVEDPTTWYVTVGGLALNDSRITASASNEYGESVHLNATLGGKVTYDSTASD
ncbi:DUF1707 domain-containing protein [Nocardioides sp. SYSU D00038]|uniref:DUF1707 SHOCT-like domain-containing protein n=1 Tax=Nocardioides sp. SYSU D00038 TaxID=2812554 RepID=UPI0019675264|nr:DUF1707 domain-containing protein [Nocardioides sp. SYSU D00038]